MYDLGESTTASCRRIDGNMTSSKTKASKPTTESSAPKKAAKKAPAKAANSTSAAVKQPKSRSTFPKLSLRAAEFDVIAGLIRSRDPSRSAARLVLVDGMTMTQAAKSTFNDEGKALSAQMVNNTITRIKAAHALICEAYAPRG